MKRIKKEKGEVYLITENKKFKPIKLNEENELIIWRNSILCYKSSLKNYERLEGLLGRDLNTLLTKSDLEKIITQAVIKINKKSTNKEDFFKYHNSNSVL